MQPFVDFCLSPAVFSLTPFVSFGIIGLAAEVQPKILLYPPPLATFPSIAVSIIGTCAQQRTSPGTDDGVLASRNERVSSSMLCYRWVDARALDVSRPCTCPLLHRLLQAAGAAWLFRDGLHALSALHAAGLVAYGLRLVLFCRWRDSLACFQNRRK